MIFHILSGYKGVDWVMSQDFGVNGAYYKKYGHDGHNGWDFAPLFKDKEYILYAPHDGIVRCYNEGNVGYGQYVEVTGYGRKSYLAHLKKFLVSDGTKIAQGDPVGIMGGAKTDPGHGDSTGKHVHWTYKVCDEKGVTLNRNNGKGGAIDVAKFIQMWESGRRLK